MVADSFIFWEELIFKDGNLCDIFFCLFFFLLEIQISDWNIKQADGKTEQR